jgi:hypothetical protein
MTSKGVKIKGTRFNIIDLVIVIVVIACIVGTVFRSAILEKLSFAASRDEIRISFCAENLTEEQCGAIKKGEKLYFGKELFGEILSLTSSSQTVLAYDEEIGSFKSAVDDKLFVLTGELTVKGKNTDHGFFFGSSTHIGVGKMLNLEGEKCDISILITKIAENDA